MLHEGESRVGRCMLTSWSGLPPHLGFAVQHELCRLDLYRIR